MNYKAGDEVLVKSLDWYYQNRDRMEQVDCGNACFIRSMTKLCEKKVTISSVLPIIEVYHIKEDDGTFNWTDEMFEGLVEEETKPLTFSDSWECPQGYQFVDENGNVVNAQKITLEKKEKMYPKTYEECAKIMGVELWNTLWGEDATEYEEQMEDLMDAFIKLKVCRDAYWKIAGEEMGLGKPWEYDCHSEYFTPAIIYRNGFVQKVGIQYRNAILTFPTDEMRDAFYENFNELIGICKELL